MATNLVKIIGVDCAVDRKNVGLAVGTVENRRVRLVYPQPGPNTKWAGAGVDEIVKWMEEGGPVLLAFDAPLGWPLELARSLANHMAGAPVGVEANDMFHRKTDAAIKARFTKVRPLEVGADKIARTAWAAVRLLNEVRHQTGLPIPLAWRAEDLEKAQVVEVYPAATLFVHGLPHQGYKRADAIAIARRGKIIGRLHELIEIPGGMRILEEDTNVLDAVVCVLAGVDFLQGEAMGPDQSELETARKEGWIWVRKHFAGHRPE